MEEVVLERPRLAICVATMRPKDPAILPGDVGLARLNAVTDPAVHVRYNTPDDNLGVVGSYQKLYEDSPEEILCYLHDDVIVRERGWDARILREFEDPAVAICGFGGARWHGTDDLYKVPYVLQNLRRGDYLSNVDDAEVHGERFAGETDVAVLDGYALVCRRRFLDRVSGWRRVHVDFFCYDYAICALSRRLGCRIRMVGIRCHHRGGGTSVSGKVKELTGQEAYDRSHRWFYDEFRDTMPARVE